MRQREKEIDNFFNNASTGYSDKPGQDPGDRLMSSLIKDSTDKNTCITSSTVHNNPLDRVDRVQTECGAVTSAKVSVILALG